MKYQISYLNKKGQLIASSNGIFSTDCLQNESVLICFPFLESIFNNLIAGAPGKSYVFEGVQTCIPCLPGIYDFTFTRLPAGTKNGAVLVWSIVDNTRYYNQKISQQQLRQEFLMLEEISQ